MDDNTLLQAQALPLCDVLNQISSSHHHHGSQHAPHCSASAAVLKVSCVLLHPLVPMQKLVFGLMITLMEGVAAALPVKCLI